jgi:hypothetical protein
VLVLVLVLVWFRGLVPHSPGWGGYTARAAGCERGKL